MLYTDHGRWKINSLGDIETRLRAGADKVCINAAAVSNKDFVSEAAKEFGHNAS